MLRLLPGSWLLLCLCAMGHAAPVFTDAERAQIVTFWNGPGRIKTTVPPDVSKTGLWQVHLTPDGSAWLLAYQIAIGQAKAPPTQDALAAPPATAGWQTWVDAKLAYDQWQAQAAADAANGALFPLNANRTPCPPPPGVIPPDLLAACGNPPLFANAITPLLTTVTFDEGEAYTYSDNVKVRLTYGYYRFPQGTVSYGPALREMTDAELAPLFAMAGFTDSEQRIARAVSKLEGGFESVNTYDTGYVSVGFIQFITGKDGRGSLLEVLQNEKADQPLEYLKDFHDYGVDVNDAGVLTVVDADTGAELTGADAVMKTISDKRLTAVWQRSGRHSTAFRVAQIKVAKVHYWPADDTVTVTLNGQTLTGKVSDVVHSEAGLATLFDRKVNRGNIAPLPDVLSRVMILHNLNSLADAVPYEREIITACKYRTDFLQDTTLSQPR